ncbi:hypothetical protein, partial [Aporhodopirellula aestuarii]
PAYSSRQFRQMVPAYLLSNMGWERSDFRPTNEPKEFDAERFVDLGFRSDEVAAWSVYRFADVGEGNQRVCL